MKKNYYLLYFRPKKNAPTAMPPKLKTNKAFVTGCLPGGREVAGGPQSSVGVG